MFSFEKTVPELEKRQILPPLHNTHQPPDSYSPSTISTCAQQQLARKASQATKAPLATSSRASPSSIANPVPLTQPIWKEWSSTVDPWKELPANQQKIIAWLPGVKFESGPCVQFKLICLAPEKWSILINNGIKRSSIELSGNPMYRLGNRINPPGNGTIVLVSKIGNGEFGILPLPQTSTDNTQNHSNNQNLPRSLRSTITPSDAGQNFQRYIAAHHPGLLFNKYQGISNNLPLGSSNTTPEGY